MKKRLVLLLAAMFILCSCGIEKPEVKSDGLTVVTTLFPTYDFARSIAGGRADITLLLTPGKESHSYEPSTGDVIRINNSDIFIFTCENMEPWAKTIVGGMDNPPTVVDASKNIVLEKEEEHDHEHEPSSHSHEYDPHIWTSPKLCLTIVDNILEAFVLCDGENAAYYRENAERLKERLTALDEEFREIVESSDRREIFHGGRFSMYYFTKEYSLSYEAAYDSCSTDTEPSVRKICSMIDEMREEKAPVVFYEELSNTSVAELIAEETGAKPLLLHSCHNLTTEEFKSGVTYFDLMEQNAENLKEALR